MSFPLIAAGAGAGLAYVATGWDPALYAKNNAVLAVMRLTRAWRIIINSSRLSWRPFLDKIDTAAEAQFFKASKSAGYRMETVSVPVEGGEINVYVHVPAERKQDAKIPIIVWFHGGGMVLLSPHDPYLVKDTLGFGIMEYFSGEVIIASVEYRRAPEYTFPVGVEDAIAATQWLSANASQFGGDSARLCAAGYSAGAYCASVVQQAARDRSFPLCCAILVCPMLRRGATTQSFLENGHRSDLPAEAMIWFWLNYCPDASNVQDPRCTPIYGIESGKLAPCIVVTAEYDVLRDEGVEYYDALKTAGVQVQHQRVRSSHLGPACDTESWAEVMQRWSALLGIVKSRL